VSAHPVASTLRGFSQALARTLVSEDAAHSGGLLQGIDPRAKLVGMLALVVASALAHRVPTLFALLAVGVGLAVASRVNVWSLARRVWLVAFAFTFMIAAPAMFLTPGVALWQWGGVVMTANGVHTAVLLVLRVEAAVTLSTLLVLTTPWMWLLKALRTLRVPVEVIALLAMTHRYLVLLAETANQMFESRQSRLVGRLKGAEQRHMMINTGGVLLSKTMAMGDEVYMAMLARGFRGEVRLLTEFRMKTRDWLAVTMLLAVAAGAVVAGR
jgi:cobalt ECF transporter T component CbiQ